jgi:hypothetical protein
MSMSERAERFERKYMGCFGQYMGPSLPGFPYEPGEIIYPTCIESAAAAFRYAVSEAKDRVRVSA